MIPPQDITTRLTDFDIAPEQRVRAIRVVAGFATDAADCDLLLAVLGLSPQDVHSLSPE